MIANPFGFPDLPNGRIYPQTTSQGRLFEKVCSILIAHNPLYLFHNFICFAGQRRHLQSEAFPKIWELPKKTEYTPKKNSPNFIRKNAQIFTLATYNVWYTKSHGIQKEGDM